MNWSGGYSEFKKFTLDYIVKILDKLEQTYICTVISETKEKGI